MSSQTGFEREQDREPLTRDQLLDWLYERRRVQAIAFGLFLVGWEWIGRATSEIFIPPPTRVATVLVELLTDPVFLSDLQFGIASLLLGVAIGAVVGLSLGTVMGFSKIAKYFFDPYITVLYATPVIAIVPLIVLVFGTGLAPRVFIIFLFTLTPITVNALEGAEVTSDELIEVGTSFGASRRDIVRHVYLPSMIPYIITALRLGVGRGIRGWIVAELFFLIGVGGRLSQFGNTFQTAHVFAVLVVIVAIGLITTRGLHDLTYVFAPWFKEQQMEGDV